MELHCLFLLTLCFVWKTNGFYLSEDERLVRKVRSLHFFDELYVKHLKELLPGQIMPHKCAYSKYGCCKDGKTFAIGPLGGGCDMIICTDKYVAACYDKKQLRRLHCTSLRDKTNCPYSCKRCKPQAPPLTKCLQKKPVNGCCWNGKTSLKRNKSDCPPCVNSFPKTCETFKGVSGGCSSGSFGVRNFMTTFCPVTCGFCIEASKSH